MNDRRGCWGGRSGWLVIGEEKHTALGPRRGRGDEISEEAEPGRWDRQSLDLSPVVALRFTDENANLSQRSSWCCVYDVYDAGSAILGPSSTAIHVPLTRARAQHMHA